MLSVRKQDKVVILWGKDKGKQGEIISLDSKKSRVIVGKLNLAKRHTRPMGQTEPGGIKDKELWLPMAKVMLICPDCKKANRPKFDSLTDGTPIRVCRKCKSTISEPKKK
jgi:large subunit ribosomal protein L24